MLPVEITDLVIDQLALLDDYTDQDEANLFALTSLSLASRSFLDRSRHHLFSNVHLNPWRHALFFRLLEHENVCTFASHVHKIHVDELYLGQERRERSRSRSRSPGPCRSLSRGHGHRQPSDESGGAAADQDDAADPDTFVPFHQALVAATSTPALLPNLSTLHIRNFDWTSISPSDAISFRHALRILFPTVLRLELQDAIFHDIRELSRVVQSFHSLRHLTANVRFTKYLDYTLALAQTICLADGVGLESVELCTEEGIPVVLTSLSSSEAASGIGITGREGSIQGGIRVLELRNLTPGHLQYVSEMLNKRGKDIQKLGLGFSDWQGLQTGLALSKQLDLSQLSDLRTLRIEGLCLHSSQNQPRPSSESTPESALPSILQRIESSFLDVVQLHFTVSGPENPSPEMEIETETDNVDWESLQQVLLALHFFGLSSVNVVLSGSASDEVVVEKAARRITKAMNELHARGVLAVSLIRT